MLKSHYLSSYLDIARGVVDISSSRYKKQPRA